MKRKLMGNRKKQLFTKRFYPAGSYNWIVPLGCTEVDVFIVGGGGGAGDVYPGGGGYTKTFKKATIGWRDGDAVKVTSGQSIPITVGKGGVSQVSNTGIGVSGEYSQFLNSTYKAEGGQGGKKGGSGGSGASGGTDGGNGGSYGGNGQGHTTRDFGESTGKRNAGGGGCNRNKYGVGGISDYTKGAGGNMYGYENDPSASQNGYGGGGYGGGAGGCAFSTSANPGGDGTVLLRYWAYSE